MTFAWLCADFMLFGLHVDVARLFKLIISPIFNKAVYIKGELKGFDALTIVESVRLNII